MSRWPTTTRRDSSSSLFVFDAAPPDFLAAQTVLDKTAFTTHCLELSSLLDFNFALVTGNTSRSLTEA